MSSLPHQFNPHLDNLLKISNGVNQDLERKTDSNSRIVSGWITHLMHVRALGRFVIALMLLRLAIIPAGPLHASSLVAPLLENDVPLILGEIAWAGSSRSTADEWLELWNLSDEDLNLAGYRLRGATANEIVFEENQVIPTKNVFVIGNYSASDPKSALALEPNAVTTSIALSNSELKIELIAPDGNVIDTAGNGSVPPAGDSPTKASMIRQPDGSWLTATTTVNMDEGLSDLGTPNICDGCFWQSVDTQSEPDLLENTPESANSEIITEASTTTELTIESTIEVTIPNEDEDDPEDLATTEIPDESTTTTLELINETTTSTELDFENTTGTTELPTLAPEPIVIVTQVSSPPPLLVPVELRLEIIFPAPISDKEWIAVSGLGSDEIERAFGWTLRDAGGTIYSFSTTTQEQVMEDSGLLIIQLSSARLNNSGDSVELVRPNGSIAERMQYPETTRGKRWIKNMDRTAWIIDPPPDPIIVEQTIQVPDETIEPITVELPAVAPLVSEEIRNVTTSKAVATKTAAKTPAKKTTQNQTQKETAAKIVKTTAAKTKTTAASKAEPLSSSIDMITSELAGQRVSLQGIVATKPGILPKYHFILLTREGLGLYVRGSSKQQSPPMGSRIQVTGELSANDDGIQLKMSTKDSWKLVQATDVALPRSVNLFEPGAEDAWSLLELEGKALETKASTVLLDIQGAVVELKIRPAVGYKAGRISVGDKLRVSGLLDLRGGELGFYVRAPEDITILDHAKLAQAKSLPTKTLPDWTPFGAAGVTVAVAESWKRVRRWQRNRKIQRLIADSQSVN